MEEKRNVLIVTLGDTPAVIAEIINKLAEEKIHLEQVLVLYTEGVRGIKDNFVNNYLLGTMGYNKSNSQEIYIKTNSTPKFGDNDLLPDEYIFINIGVEDIYPSTEERVENAIYYYVLRESTKENTNLYVSIAGGRKTESAVGYAAGLFFGATEILHVLLEKGVRDEDIGLLPPGNPRFEEEINKYGLVKMQRIAISDLFRIAFRKRFFIDIREIEHDDVGRFFKIKGEDKPYSAPEIIGEVSSTASKIIKTGLKSFINLNEAIEEFGKIMQDEKEIPLYRKFANFIQDDILLSEDLGVNWKIRWLWGLNVYPEFVNHDIDHSGEVLTKASKIIKEFEIGLNPLEKLILALGIMFHDIGMTGFGDKFHWTEVRKIHGILSAMKLKDQEGKIFRINKIFTEDVWKAVRTICAFHDGEKFFSFNGEFAFGTKIEEEVALLKEANCFTEGITLDGVEWLKVIDTNINGKDIKLNLLTALLRLADACDMGRKMLMGETVKELQTKWNRVGKSKAIELAKALINLVDNDNRNKLCEGLKDLETLDVTGKNGKNGTKKAKELFDFVKDNLSSQTYYNELKEVFERIYYFFKQSPDHYDFHEKIEDIIIEKQGEFNKIIVKIQDNSNEEVSKEANERLEKETKILKNFGLRIEVIVEQKIDGGTK